MHVLQIDTVYNILLPHPLYPSYGGVPNDGTMAHSEQRTENECGKSTDRKKQIDTHTYTVYNIIHEAVLLQRDS